MGYHWVGVAPPVTQFLLLLPCPPVLQPATVDQRDQNVTDRSPLQSI